MQGGCGCVLRVDFGGVRDGKYFFGREVLGGRGDGEKEVGWKLVVAEKR